MSNDNGTPAIQRRGLMLVLSSPSGAGKTTLSRQLLDNDKQIQLSVSCTTRRSGPARRDGVDYRFVDTATFRGMIERKRVPRVRRGVRPLLRNAEARRSTRRWRPAATCCSTSTGRARSNCATRAGADLVTVFILPPSTRDLEKPPG